jgi:4-hydroxybenzoate polyprenyltransferase
MYNLLRLIRPHQYLKNGFVFLGVLFGTHDLTHITQALWAFVAFCAVASSVYVMNDILDVEVDRQHPLKRMRPIAAGAVSISVGWSFSLGLLALALAIAVWVGWLVAVFVLIYWLLNVGYSLHWKQVVVLDVFVISTGFMLRILAGTVGIGIAPSSWLLLCGLMTTLFLGFAKRGAELRLINQGDIDPSGQTRAVLDQYGAGMIDQFMAISAACVILSYSLYTVSAETVARHGTGHLVWTVPFVVYGVFRYIYLLHMRSGGNDTARDLLADRHLVLTLVGWLATTLAILW